MTISRMRSLGIIKGEQPRPNQEVEETLTLEVPATGFLTVFRRWFDASLTLKAMAAWLFLLVGTSKGPVVWAREIRDRFGWDPKTCGKVVRELDEAGRLSTSAARGDGGRYRGFGYQAEKWEKPHSEKPHNQNLHDILKTPSTEDLPTNPSVQGRVSQQGYYGSRALREEPPPFFDAREEGLHEQRLEEQAAVERTAAETHYGAIMDRTMLGWIDQHTLTEAVFDGGPYEEHLEAVYSLANDTELRQRLQWAANGRIGRRLLAPEGLHTARWLAAALVREPGEAQEAVTPAEALAAVLEAVAARIGRRPDQWLNSWELIGHRIAGRHYDCGDPAEQVFGQASPLLGILVGNDPALGLSTRLKGDASGLTAFVREEAAKHDTSVDQVGEIMRGVLARGLLGDIRRGAIRSWRYFAGPIADEMQKIALTAEGIRPGDVFGEHKRRSRDA